MTSMPVCGLQPVRFQTGRRIRCGTFGQFDLFVYALLYIVHHTTQVAVATLAEITILRFTFSRLIVFGPIAERMSAT